MTNQELLGRIQTYYGKRYNADQSPMIEKKLGRYSESDLDRLFDKLIDESKFLPKAYEIFDAADKLGLDKKTQAEKKNQAAGCSRCAGAGKLLAWCQASKLQTTGTDLATLAVKVLRVEPYSVPSSEEDFQSQGARAIYSLLYRCTCSDEPESLMQWDGVYGWTDHVWKDSADYVHRRRELESNQEHDLMNAMAEIKL